MWRGQPVFTNDLTALGLTVEGCSSQVFLVVASKVYLTELQIMKPCQNVPCATVALCWYDVVHNASDSDDVGSLIHCY